MGKRIEAFLIAAVIFIASAVCTCAVTMDGKKTDDNYNKSYLTFFGSTEKSGCDVKNVLCYMQTKDNTMYIVTDMEFADGLSADNTLAGVIFYIDGAEIKADMTGTIYDDAEGFDSDKFDYDYVSLYRRPDALSIETRILFKDGISDPQSFTVKFIDDRGVKSAKCNVRYSASEEYAKTTTAASTEKTTKEKTTKATTTKTTTEKTTTVKTTTAVQAKTTAAAAASAAKAKTTASASRNIFRASAKSAEGTSSPSTAKQKTEASTKFRAPEESTVKVTVSRTKKKITDRDDVDETGTVKYAKAHTDEYTTSSSNVRMDPEVKRIIAAAAGILIVVAVCVVSTPAWHRDRNNSDKEKK